MIESCRSELDTAAGRLADDRAAARVRAVAPGFASEVPQWADRMGWQANESPAVGIAVTSLARRSGGCGGCGRHASMNRDGFVDKASERGNDYGPRGGGDGRVPPGHRP